MALGARNTYHTVNNSGLDLVRGLQLLKPVLRVVEEAEGGLLFHKAQLGLDIRGLLLTSERVPCVRISALFQASSSVISPEHLPCSPLRLGGAGPSGRRVLGGGDGGPRKEERDAGDLHRVEPDFFRGRIASTMAVFWQGREESRLVPTLNRQQNERCLVIGVKARSEMPRGAISSRGRT